MEKMIQATDLLGDIVTNDIRAAEIFRDAGLDFCCGGRKSLAQACSEKGIDSGPLLTALSGLGHQEPSPETNFRDWEPGRLADHIVNRYHRYVWKTLVDLVFYTRKIASVHGAHHPELSEIAELTEKLNTELHEHMKTEEEILFPAIKDVIRTDSDASRAIIRSVTGKLGEEHESAGGAMDTINTLTGGYRVPADGCGTYHLTYKLLKQFEDDLHIHVHLENNILFKKAQKL